MKCKLFLIFWFMVVLSCKNPKTQETASESKKLKWEMLKINVNNQSIWVPANDDTCFFYHIFKEDTVYAKQHNQYRSERKKFTLPKVERDSLFLLSEDAIKNPVNTDNFVTDYVGEYVSISLEYGNMAIECKYSSISSWSSISPTLKKINQMTFEKIKSTP